LEGAGFSETSVHFSQFIRHDVRQVFISVSNLATSQPLGLVQVSILCLASREVAEVLNYWFQNHILDIYSTGKRSVFVDSEDSYRDVI
jgi:hypothetical protein